MEVERAILATVEWVAYERYLAAKKEQVESPGKEQRVRDSYAAWRPLWPSLGYQPKTAWEIG